MRYKFLKQFSKIYSSVLFIIFFFNNTIFSHGFIAGTLVKTKDNFIPIELLKENTFITTYDFKEKKTVESKIVQIKKRNYNKFYKLKINDEEIVATPDQKFFVPLRKNRWLKIEDIKKNDFVIRDIKDLVRIKDITEINQQLDSYEISVDKNHNYFVSKQLIFVHNEAITLTLGTIYGFEAVVEIGVWALGALGIWAGQQICGSNKDKNTSFMTAKAPGKPTTEDGFIPSKNWDGKKKRHEVSGGYGYPDKNGNIWVPTGENGHGGPHWDVQKPNGGYDNVMPGGKIRSGKK